MKTVKNSYTTYQTQGVDRRFLDSHCPSHLSQSHLLLILYIKLPYKHLSKNFSRKSVFAHNFCACTGTFTPQFLISTPVHPHTCVQYTAPKYMFGMGYKGSIEELNHYIPFVRTLISTCRYKDVL